MKSLDPRVNRMNLDESKELETLGQNKWNSFEVFHQKKSTLKYTHVGSLHAINMEMAMILAKEQFGRRQMTSGLWVVRTAKIFTSGETINTEENDLADNPGLYEVFYQKKTGTAFIRLGQVESNNHNSAMEKAKQEWPDIASTGYWVWHVDDLLKLDEDVIEIFESTPSKVHREAPLYKTRDKITAFKNRHS